MSAKNASVSFLLVDPPHRIWDILKAWVPSPGCLQLAAYLLEYFDDVDFMDCTLNKRPWQDLEEKLRQERPKVVGISIGCTYFTYDGYNAAALVKEALPEAIVLAGGAHPTLNAEECLAECPDIDFICLGEGEITAREFLANVADGNPDFSHIPGLAYRDRLGEVVNTGKRALIEDLDTLPMPAYNLVDMEHPYVGLPSEGKRAFLVNFARGCGYRCKFCSESVFWERKWRGRGSERIGDELELLKKKYDRDTFYVGDNVFNFTRERATGFIEQMKKRKLGQHFWLQSRADLVVRDQDLMPGYKEAGVYQFMVGVEYPKQEVLNSLDKDVNLPTVEKAMQILKKHEFMIMATLMIGHWDETKEDRQNLFDFCARYVNHFGLNVVTPLPGTEFYKEMKELGRIKSTDYRKFDYIQAVMPTRDIPDLSQITDLHLGMIRKFYWRPVELWRMFFSKNPILRHHHRYFMKYGFEVMQHELFGKPLWMQDNYQSFDSYLRERERPMRGAFKGYEPDETIEL